MLDIKDIGLLDLLRDMLDIKHIGLLDVWRDMPDIKDIPLLDIACELPDIKQYWPAVLTMCSAEHQGQWSAVRMVRYA